MPKKKIVVRGKELKAGDTILYNRQFEDMYDIEREEPYKTGTILLIKSGLGLGDTLEQVVHRIADSAGNRGSWLSTRGGGGGQVNFYSNDEEIEKLIAKSGGVEVLREGTGA